MCLLFVLSLFSEFTPKPARSDLYIDVRMAFDTSKALTLIKNGIDGLIKDYPAKKITIEFSSTDDPILVNANVLMEGKLIFIYNIDIKSYAIVGYKDLRKENENVISED